MFNQLIAISVEATNNGMDLITAVDGFYNSAWNKLIIVGSVSLAIVGVLVPIIIQIYQKRVLKANEEVLKKDIETQVQNAKTELLEYINDKMAENFQIFEEKMAKLNASSTAKAFHLQGNTQFGNKEYSGALADYITASENYLICEDYNNIQIVLRLICEECLPHLSKEEIGDIAIGKNANIDVLLEKLDGQDDGIFTSIIRSIRLKISKLPHAIKDKR